MATNATKKISVSLRLNNGEDSEGNVKTLGVSLGKLTANPSDYDDDKMLAVKNLIAPCLEKAVYATEKSIVSVVSA